jgi:ketosteroid isomerase-like protein
MAGNRGQSKTIARRLSKFTVAAVAAIIICSIANGRARQSAEASGTAAREVRALLDRQVVAWNAHDLEGFMAGYWKSPELTFFSGGTREAGWDQTMRRYIDRYTGAGKEMGTLDFSELQIEILGPRAAFVRGKWHLKLTNGDAGGLFTLIFRKLPNGWRIIHDHTSAAPQ